MYADLHIHSCCSDGTMRPEDIAREAKAKGVSLISIADHDTLDAWDVFPAACADHGMRYLSAVELHSQWGSTTCHVLAYGFDLQDESFRELVVQNRAKLEGMSDRLIQRMEANFSAVSVADYREYRYEPTRGGWKGINYLLDRGLSESQLDAAKYYKQYGCDYAQCDFLPVEELCARVHAAGATAVLAHPGDYLHLDDGFHRRLGDLLGRGIEGLECYYPLQDNAYTAACLEYCARNDLIVTCGSDFHGSFLPDTEICKLKIPVERLRLKGLADKMR